MTLTVTATFQGLDGTVATGTNEPCSKRLGVWILQAVTDKIGGQALTRARLDAAVREVNADLHAMHECQEIGRVWDRVTKVTEQMEAATRARAVAALDDWIDGLATALDANGAKRVSVDRYDLFMLRDISRRLGGG